MTTNGVTDTATFKNLPIIAVASLAIFAKVGAIALPLLLAPTALNISSTELLLSKMNSYQISQEAAFLALAGLFMLTLGTGIASFVLLPLPMALIVVITSTVICVNNCVRIDAKMEEGGISYLQRYKVLVEKAEISLKSKMRKIISEADEKMRQENTEKLKKITEFLESKAELKSSYESIDKRHKVIMQWEAEIEKLSVAS